METGKKETKKIIQIPEILEIIITDLALRRSLWKFGEKLDEDIEVRRKLEITYANCLINLLSNWVERKCETSALRLKDLTNILSAINCNSLKEKLENKYSPDTLIAMENFLDENGNFLFTPANGNVAPTEGAQAQAVQENEIGGNVADAANGDAPGVSATCHIPPTEETAAQAVQGNETGGNDANTASRNVPDAPATCHIPPTAEEQATEGKETGGSDTDTDMDTIPLSTQLVGREKELQFINKALKSEQTKIILITGRSGEGKTSLCHQWLKTAKDDDDYVIIIHLTGDSVLAFTNGIYRFGKSISDDFSSCKSISEMAHHISAKIEGIGIVVWVIHDLNTMHEEIETFLKCVQEKQQTAKIIVTSEKVDLLPLEDGVKNLPLSTLPSADAYKFVELILGKNVQGTQDLCEAMGHHALSIELALGVMRLQRLLEVAAKEQLKGDGITIIPRYLSVYEEMKTQLFHNQKPLLLDHEKTVLVNVKIILEMIYEMAEIPLTTAVMLILSTLREQGIGLEVITEIIIHFCGEFSQPSQGTDPTFPLFRKAVRNFHAPLFALSAQGADLNLVADVAKAVKLLEIGGLIGFDESGVYTHDLISKAVRILFPEWKLIARTLLVDAHYTNLNSMKMLEHILHAFDLLENEKEVLQTCPALWKAMGIRMTLLKMDELCLSFMLKFEKIMAHQFPLDISKQALHSKMGLTYGLCMCKKFDDALTLITEAYQKTNLFYGVADPLTIRCAFLKRIITEEVSGSFEISTILQDFRKSLPDHLVEEEGWEEFRALLQNIENAKRKEELKRLESLLPAEIREKGHNHLDVISMRIDISFLESDRNGKQVGKRAAEMSHLLALSRKLFGEMHPKTMRLKVVLPNLFLRLNEIQKAMETFKLFFTDVKTFYGVGDKTAIKFKFQYVIALLANEDFEEAKKELTDFLVEAESLGEENKIVQSAQNYLKVLGSEEEEDEIGYCGTGQVDKPLYKILQNYFPVVRLLTVEYMTTAWRELFKRGRIKAMCLGENDKHALEFQDWLNDIVELIEFRDSMILNRF